MARKAPARRFDWRGFILLCAIFLAVAFLWNTGWVNLLKLFVVLLHETSHGLAALATGGRIESIHVLQQECGWTVTSGGNAYVITSAGYLGSMLFGAAILVVSCRTRLSNWIALLLGVGVAAVAMRCMPRDGRIFALISAGLLASLSLTPRWAAEIVLRVIGVTSCLYAILDVKSDVLDRVNTPSDATALAKMTGVPSVVWGAVWIAVSLAVTFLAAKWAVTGAKTGEVDSKQR